MAFIQLGGASKGDLASTWTMPFWDQMVALAPTLAYDAAILGDGGPPTQRLADIHQQTMVLARSRSDPHMPAFPAEFFAAAADGVTIALPYATRRTIDAASHAVDATAVAAPVREFLAG